MKRSNPLDQLKQSTTVDMRRPNSNAIVICKPIGNLHIFSTKSLPELEEEPWILIKKMGRICNEQLLLMRDKQSVHDSTHEGR